MPARPGTASQQGASYLDAPFPAAFATLAPGGGRPHGTANRPAPEPELHHTKDDPQVVRITGLQAAAVVEQRGVQKVPLPLVQKLGEGGGHDT